MNPIAIKLHRPALKADLKGRKTVPASGLSDAEFVYTPSIQTDLAKVFARARAQMGVRKTEKAA